jgi:hypothetical protein
MSLHHHTCSPADEAVNNVNFITQEVSAAELLSLQDCICGSVSEGACWTLRLIDLLSSHVNSEARSESFAQLVPSAEWDMTWLASFKRTSG